MHSEIFLPAEVGFILLGLIQSAERILEIHHKRREQGNAPKIYL